MERPRRSRPLPAPWLACLAVALAAGACTRVRFEPDRATRFYPHDRHSMVEDRGELGPVRVPRSIDVQVFRDGAHITLVNATPRTYRDVDVWINQRYLLALDELPAGGRRRLPLGAFYDARGEHVIPGGFFSPELPTPVRLVELDTGEGILLGLIVVGRDE